jgi:hypothetical protein
VPGRTAHTESERTEWEHAEGRVRAGGPPVLQVGPSREAAGSGSVVAGRNKDSCLADETAAQDTLKQNWPKYLAADKSDCVTLENGGGPASYVELASCLEVMRDARTIRNADPLESDLGPAPAAGVAVSASDYK